MSTSISAGTGAIEKPFIVDADSHWVEHPELFTRLAPEKYRDRVPRSPACPRGSSTVR
jgi:hypothetical protein